MMILLAILMDIGLHEMLWNMKTVSCDVEESTSVYRIADVSVVHVR
jgi:hypothetical protein